MNKSKRRHFTPEQKAGILARHFIDKVPVSDLCDELGLQPSVFYSWQRHLFENASSAFQDGKKNRRAETTALDRELSKNQALESKLVRKNEVIAEISQEVVDLKKSLGAS